MKHVSKIGILLIAMAVLAFAITAGCASAPLRTDASTSGIRAAEEVGAAKVPQAPLHVQLAKEELELAQNLSKKGDKEEAKSMLLRAEADAELAVTLSHGDAEKSIADKAMARVRQLRQENP
jgi:hypothetical protein